MLRDSIKDQFTDFTLPLKQKNKFNCVRLHLTTTTKTEAEPGVFHQVQFFHLCFHDINTSRETCTSVERFNLFNFINGHEHLSQNISTKLKMFKRDGIPIHQGRFV